MKQHACGLKWFEQSDYFSLDFCVITWNYPSIVFVSHQALVSNAIIIGCTYNPRDLIGGRPGQ